MSTTCLHSSPVNDATYTDLPAQEDTDCGCEPFIPDLSYLDHDSWHNAALVDAVGNFKIRLFRAFFIMIGPITLLILATFRTMTLSFMIGIGLLGMFVIYFVIILRLIFFCGNHENADAQLYRVYSISAKPPKWAADVNVGYIQLLYRTHSIQSISELSAINGAVTKVMLNTLGAYTWICVAIHYAYQTQNPGFHWDIADICTIFGGIGLLWISLFELDPFISKMKIMHNLGALCGGGTVIGFNLQQYALNDGASFWFALIVAFVCFGGFITWIIIGVATDLAQRGKKHNCIFTPLAKLLVCNYRNIKVTTYSRLNIGFEAIFLFMGALSLCLFLINYDNVCEYGCAARNQN